MNMKENEIRNDSNKKSIVILTIIAICTMIVTLVGATFAYLANNVQSEVRSKLDITTEGSGFSDIFLLNAGDALILHADENNFYKNAGNVSVVTDPSVTLSTESVSKVTYKYNVSLKTSYNDFEYTTGVCKDTSGNILTADSKNNCSGIWNYDNNAELALVLYKEDFNSTCKYSGVCVNKKYEIVSINKDSCTGSYTFIPNIVENNKCYKALVTKDITKAVSDNKIDLLTGEEITAQNGTNKIDYKIKISFINYEHEQNINANKKFTGVLSFYKVD